MYGTHNGPTPSHRGKGPGRRRFLGLVATGVGAVGAAGIGELAFAADEVPVRTYHSQRGIDHQKWAVAKVLRSAEPAAVAAWITGTGAAPGELKAEMDAQVGALADAAAAGLGVARGSVVVSWMRAASVQRQIWDRKYDFLRTGSGGAGTFGIVTDDMRAKYRAQLGTDPQWDPDKDAHREVWAALTPDERQIEILRTSTAPGVSRHHLGSDADFFDTTPQNWADGGTEAADYAWLRANAAHYGFLQTYTAETAKASPAISEERWHWSYAPVSEAVLDYVRADESLIEGALDQLWSYDPARYTYIKAHWREYMFHVNEKAYFGG
ncbi:D-alanyl-D-alanine carboxypeptidase family protein [Streptomyces sp. NRRL WC-3618]|uniref:D-alanyl-D-alanine carboxypeptidase family protein n=1 Tax=Streptomyces sp. NRRL WC-3618 TaxID=1519490 RepID=UPI0006AE9510|nr:D-alanyl-D-alanine carboxypeptidase family protein [Streptomyces sp. NRRL WC-3618]